MQITDLVFIDETGYHFADYPTFLQWRQDQYRAIYGADVYLESDSQDGQLLAVQAKADYDTAALGSAIYSSFTPAGAQGTGLSRLVKINGLKRQVPSRSTADLTVVGQSGTVLGTVENPAIAIDTNQQKWILPITTIPSGGTVVATAVADTDGAINAESSTINSIFTPTRGWQTVNNAAAATPGAPVESDATLRLRQSVSTANPSLTVFDGTVGGVENLTGVTKVKGYENVEDTTDGDGLPPHSISLIVVGGDAVEICQEILLHKTPGTKTFGNTSETVYDAHGMPNVIAFGRSVDATISVEITLSTGVGWSTDFETLIADAVASVVATGPIGEDVILTKLYAPAYLAGTAPGTTYTVSLLRLKKNAGSFGTSDITLAYNENPLCNPTTNVTFIIT